MIKRSFLIIFLDFIICGLISCRSTQLSLENLKEVKDGKFTCYFDNLYHDFIIDLPDNYDSTRKTPLIVLLHGYGNSAEAFRNATEFHEAANPRGYAVVYVTGAKNKKDKTSSVGWNSGISKDGNKDVEFLVALVNYLQEEYGFDKSRIYSAGFSNGGFMNHRLAMEAEETFRACVSVAGKMPVELWNLRNEKNNISFMQVSGEKDDGVPKNSNGTAKYARDPAIEDVMEYWATSNNLDENEIIKIANGSILTKWNSKKNESVNQVWHLLVKDGYHSWPTKELNGIEINEIILDFFDEIK